MMTFKHKLRMFVAIYFNNYFIRGATRPSSIVSMLGVVATLIILLFGKSNLFIIFIPTFILAVVLFTLYGKWDYSPRGTRTPETKKYWESDFGIAPWISLYKMIEKIAEKEGVEQDEDFKNMKLWLEKVYKENHFGEMVKEDLEKRD